MKLRVKLSEEEYGSLSDELKENYAQAEDGFLLTVEGMTHEDVSGLKSALQKERENRKSAEGALEQFKAENKQHHRYQNRFYAAKRDAAISEALAMEGGNPEILAPFLRERIKVNETSEGHVSYQVLGKDGNPLLSGDGKPLGVDEFVKSLKSHDAYKGSFRGTGNSGGNSFEGDGASMPRQFAPMKKRSQMSSVEKVDYINEHGQAAFNRLPM